MDGQQRRGLARAPPLTKIRIGERIVQKLFALLELRPVLKPVATESYADFKQARLNALTPELAWDFILLGDDKHLASPPEIDEDDIAWELQILADGQQLYRPTSLAGQRHQVEEPLDSCQKLTWSVRPRYRLRSWIEGGKSSRKRSNNAVADTTDRKPPDN